MEILVTGGGGFAGRHLLRQLLRAGYSDLSATLHGTSPRFEPTDELSRVAWLSMDVTSPESIREVVAGCRPERVFHLAGQASVGRSFELPVETWEVNATGTVRLLAALREHAPDCRRMLLVSSAEVYGLVPESKQPIREAARCRPVTPYGVSKAAAEVAALQYPRSGGIEVVIARSFNHIGPGQDERFVFPSIARQLARIRGGGVESVVRAGNLSVERDFLDVRDAARAYHVLMEQGGNGEAYNVCSGIAQSLAAGVHRMIELSETGARLELDPERVRAVDIPALRGDCARLRALGWAPRIGRDETLRDLLAEALVEV